MNNERFRFRAWSTTHKEMVYFEGLPSWLVGDDTVVIQQCTGLRDSEGTLIWEGDVCEYIPPTITKERIGIVVWSDKYGGWFFDGKPKSPVYNSVYKVLGDQFEHPSLIERGGAVAEGEYETKK